MNSDTGQYQALNSLDILFCLMKHSKILLPLGLLQSLLKALKSRDKLVIRKTLEVLNEIKYESEEITEMMSLGALSILADLFEEKDAGIWESTGILISKITLSNQFSITQGAELKF